MLSYEEKDLVLTVIDHLKCLKKMFDAGIDISGIDFSVDYPTYADGRFFLDLLKKFFPGMWIMTESENADVYYSPCIEVYLPMEELKNLPPDTLETVERSLNDLLIEEDFETGFYREYTPVQEGSLVYDHQGRAVAIVLRLVESTATFYPEVQVLVEIYRLIKKEATVQ